MSYPNAMKAMAADLKLYSSTTRRIDPLGKSDGIKAGDNVKFYMPANALIDFRTLKLHFKATTTASTADGVVALPTPIQGLIDLIKVSFNGVAVETTPNNYGFLHKMIDDFTVGKTERESRALLGNELFPGLALDQELFHGCQTITLDSAHQATSLVNGYRDLNRKFVIDSFPGSFLGTIHCPILSTACTGDILVEVRFAQNNVLTCVGTSGKTPNAPAFYGAALPPSQCGKRITGEDAPKRWYDIAGSAAVKAAPSSPSYTLNDVYFTIKSMDIADNNFYSWLNSEIERAPLQLTHTHWQMQPGNQTSTTSLAGTTRMTLTNPCVNKLVGTFVPSDNTSGYMIPGQSVVFSTAEAVSTSVDGTYGNSHSSRAFQRGHVATANDDYLSQWEVNNIPIGVQQGVNEVWATLKEEMNLGKSSECGFNPRIRNVQHFARAHFADVLRLNFKTSEREANNVRYMSGLNAKNAIINVYWKVLAGSPDASVQQVAVTPQLWAESTELLLLKPQQRWELA